MKKYLSKTVRIAVAVILAIICLVFNLSDTIKLILCILGALTVGIDQLIECVQETVKGEIFNENTLMLIASVAAICIGEWIEGVAVLVFFSVGELLEEVANDKSREKIIGINKLKTFTARVLENGTTETVEPSTVRIGSVLEVLSGESIPIDGVLLDNSAVLDLKAVTGESRVYNVAKGEKLYSGAINVGAPIKIKTVKAYKDSNVEKIIALVEGANSKKAKSQKFISKFAKIYTPVVVALSIVVAFVPPVLFGKDLLEYVYKALSFLVISCPCALVISVPLSYFLGIGGLAKNGVLVKGSEYIDSLCVIKTAVFDKTGTLTEGNLTVENVSLNGKISERELKTYIYALEIHSNHPIAKKLCEYAKSETPSKIVAEDVREIAGLGIVGIIDGKKVSIGNSELVKFSSGFKSEKDKQCVYVCIDGVFVATVYLTDKIKSNAKTAISALKKTGINKTVIISGDEKEIAYDVGNKVGIDTVYSKLLPDEKVDRLREISKVNGGKVMFVGDGINDSPSIATADVGVAMGGLGSEIAVESSDVVILDDNLIKIPLAIRQSKKVKKIVCSNIVLSIAVKVSVMVLALVIRVPLWLATFSDVGVMLIAVLNSLRAFNTEKLN